MEYQLKRIIVFSCPNIAIFFSSLSSISDAIVDGEHEETCSSIKNLLGHLISQLIDSKKFEEI